MCLILHFWSKSLCHRHSPSGHLVFNDPTVAQVLVADSSNTFASSEQVTGKAYAASYAAPTPAMLTSAVSAMEAAYTDAAGRSNPDLARKDLKGGIIGGETLTPGVYTWTTGVTLNTDVTFTGDSENVFILQSAGNLVVASDVNVILTGGVKAENIFWQFAGNAAIGTGAHMEGILLIKTDVTFRTSSSLNGRIFAQTATNLQMATITEPAAATLSPTVSPAVSPTVSPTASPTAPPTATPTVSPTVLVYVIGSFSSSGISLADAEANRDVFVASIASVAGVEESTVEVTGFSVAEARRRRLLDDEAALTVDYKILAAANGKRRRLLRRCRKSCMPK